MDKNLEAWSVSERDYPANASVTEKLRFCVRYAVLGPSTYNNQPWYFAIENNTISVFADRRYALPVLDPDDRQLMMSCASALFNLRLAMRYFGLGEYTQLIPNPAEEDLIARVQVADESYEPTEDEKALFKAITKRQMNRSAFENKEVPKALIESLKHAAKQENAWLYICEGDERDVISHFVAEGDHIQMSKKPFRRELCSWITGRRFMSGDGEPDYARSFKDMMDSPKPRIVRRFEVEPGQVVPDERIAEGCPVLAILGSEKGGQVNRLYAGQAFMRVLLQAEKEGLSVCTLNQPCEVPDLRLRLQDEIEHYHGRAQFILRVGYGEPAVNYSPRRPLDQVILEPTAQRHFTKPANDMEKTRKTGLWSRFQKIFS